MKINNNVSSHLEDDFNTIASFLAKRDIKELTSEALYKEFQIREAELMIILGNSIPYISELAAKAFKAGVSKELMIVGGIGHSAKYLIENVKREEEYKGIDVHDKSEAEVLQQIVVKTGNVKGEEIIIESKSTNCGSNAYEALKLLKEMGKVPASVILLQDPTMQLRTHASFKKEWQEENTLLISFSPFIPRINTSTESFEFKHEGIKGLWSFERFVDIILGEIPRLRNDENGYGPKGKGFIAQVDIPDEVLSSYQNLLQHYSEYSEIKDRK